MHRTRSVYQKSHFLAGIPRHPILDAIERNAIQQVVFPLYSAMLENRRCTGLRCLTMSQRAAVKTAGTSAFAKTVKFKKLKKWLKRYKPPTLRRLIERNQ